MRKCSETVKRMECHEPDPLLWMNVCFTGCCGCAAAAAAAVVAKTEADVGVFAPVVVDPFSAVDGARWRWPRQFHAWCCAKMRRSTLPVAAACIRV